MGLIVSRYPWNLDANRGGNNVASSQIKFEKVAYESLNATVLLHHTHQDDFLTRLGEESRISKGPVA